MLLMCTSSVNSDKQKCETTSVTLKNIKTISSNVLKIVVNDYLTHILKFLFPLYPYYRSD